MEASQIFEQDLIHLAMDPVLAKRMEKKFMIKIDLGFNKDTGLVELFPKPEEWLKEMTELIRFDVEEISFVPCFAANEIGSARENGRVKIFEENDEFVESSIENIVRLFSYLLKMPCETERII